MNAKRDSSSEPRLGGNPAEGREFTNKLASLRETTPGPGRVNNHVNLKESFAGTLIQYDEAHVIPRSNPAFEEFLRQARTK